MNAKAVPLYTLTSSGAEQVNTSGADVLLRILLELNYVASEVHAIFAPLLPKLSLFNS